MRDNTPDEHAEDAIRDDAEEAPPVSRLDLPDVSRPRTVGEMLAAERRRQGKSVGDVADATKIRARLIEALEGGAFEQLPSPAYVRGYIQNYATVLGRSPEPYLEAYRLESTEPGIGSEPAAGMGDPIVPQRDQAHAIPTRLLAGVVVFIAVVGLLWLALTLIGGSDTEPAPLPPVEGDVAPSETPTDTSPGVAPEETEDNAPQDDATSVQPFEMTVTVEDTDASWLRITVDGDTVYEGTLDGGESRTYQVEDLASVRIGRPSVVSITRDGLPVEIPNTGELPTVELAADE